MIQFLDLHKINKRFQNEFENAFSMALENSNFVLGDNVKNFENEFANYCGSNYCIGTANGLDALTLILKGYIQLGKLNIGDKVMVPSNTFIASILSIIHAGLKPVLVEPDPKTYNLSIDAVKSSYSKEVKAIVIVHLYGQLADMSAFLEFTNRYNILLIEDAAQAHGAKSKQGLAGNLSHAAAFSFYPSKNLGALGDGGSVTTNDEALNEKIRLLRNYGSKTKYKNEIIGANSRLDDMQAAFLSIKLKELDKDNERRRVIARRYLNEINNLKVKLPFYDGSSNHVFYAFVVELEDRENFINYLDSNDVQSLIHYPIPPHKQTALHHFSHLNLPIAEKIHKRVISLPMSPVMTTDEINWVIKTINNY
ncbi:MAG: DegT/DnrJ/EryC1/StrS family aminotransferase [Winogradskyella sp.]|uniref:DegT/DnrJ/EryC1/StrS family aminotransferase n=1 Tax=Winogradskyella sp. TaxID=1883156 RepID=UPI00180AFAF6|nr:DegT/DnrJ/EryC1/StrS family aminotransferase [Winogradskyella sp.]